MNIVPFPSVIQFALEPDASWY